MLSSKEKSSEGVVFQWFLPLGSKQTRGVALVIHGLNLKPPRMTPLINCLTQNGMDALLLSLNGHSGNHGVLRQSSPDVWKRETLIAYNEARQRAIRKRLPLHFVGYSLGGLLGCELLISCPDTSFDRMVLFAPALKTRLPEGVSKLLTLLPELAIPSLSPTQYRSNAGISTRVYASLLSMVSHLERRLSEEPSLRELLNLPTLLIIDKRDELVSLRKLRKMIRRRRLDQWRIHELEDTPGGCRVNRRHLIIDPESVGETTWGEINDHISLHLDTV